MDPAAMPCAHANQDHMSNLSGWKEDGHHHRCRPQGEGGTMKLQASRVLYIASFSVHLSHSICLCCILCRPPLCRQSRSTSKWLWSLASPPLRPVGHFGHDFDSEVRTSFADRERDYFFGLPAECNLARLRHKGEFDSCSLGRSVRGWRRGRRRHLRHHLSPIDQA